MPIGVITPGSPVTVTPDASPSQYSSVTAPTATMDVVASDIQALTLVTLNIQNYLKKLHDDLINGVITAPNLKTTLLNAVSLTAAAGAISTAAIGDLDVTGTSGFHDDATFDGGAVSLATPTNVTSSITGSGSASIAGSYAVGAHLAMLLGNRISWVPTDVPDLAGVTTVFSVSDGDTFYLATQTANAIMRLTATGALEGHRIFLTTLFNGAPQITDASKVITVQNGDGSSIGGGLILGGNSGSIEWVLLEYRTSSKFQVVLRGFRP